MGYRAGLVLFAALAAACQVTINGGQGAQNPDPNAQPQANAADAGAAVATTAPTPTGRKPQKSVKLEHVLGTAANGQQAPVIEGKNDFGSSEAGQGALTGTVYFIPENSAKFPDVSQIKPSGVLYTNQLNIAPRRFNQGFPGIDNRFEWFALRYTGSFTVTAPGEHKFRLLSDDGAILYIDSKKVVDNDGIHPPSDKSGAVTLTAGSHTIQVDYYQGPRDEIALQLFVTQPGGQEHIFTAAPAATTPPATTP